MEQPTGNGVLPGPPINPIFRPGSGLNLKRQNFSALSIILSIIMVIALILLGERLIFDLNRWLNPVIDKTYTDSVSNQYKTGSAGNYDYDSDSPRNPYGGAGMAFESAGLVSSAKIYYPTQKKGEYQVWKLIIHSTIILPIFILSFLLFYLKKSITQMRPILVGGLVFAFWMIIHLLGEIIKIAMTEYRNMSIYIILIILAGIVGALAYYTQNRHTSENPAS